MARNGNLSSNGLSSLPTVESRDSASEAWCFIVALRMTSKSDFDKGRRQSATWPV